MNLSWRRTATVLGIIFAGLLVFVASLCLLLWFLLATERGTEFTINAAQRFAPGDLAIEYRSGTFAHSLQLARVQYADESVTLDLENLIFAWQPRRLFSRTLHINELSFTSLDVMVEPAATADDDPPQQEAFSLPDIDLPFHVVVDLVQLHAITLAVGDFTQHIALIELEGQSQGAHQQIQNLHVQADLVELHMQGEIHTQGYYVLDITAQAEISLPELDPLRLDLTALGDTQTLHLILDSAGLVDAQIDAELSELLDIARLSWDADIILQEVQHEALAEQVHALHFELHSEGSIEAFNLVIDGYVDAVEQGLVELAGVVHWSDMRLDIENLLVTAEEMPAQLDIDGFARFGEILEIDIRGSGSAYEFNGNQFSLTASGNQQRVDEFSLAFDMAQGSATVSGSLAWDPYLSWDIRADVSRLDFTEISDVLNGGMQVQLVSHGAFDEQLSVYARIDEMRGILLDNTIGGEGELRIEGDSFIARDFNLRWGEAQLRADGSYSPQGIDLDFLMSVPDLSVLLSDAQGALHARGDVSGSEHAPQLDISVSGENLRWQLYQVDSLSAQLTADGTLARLPVGNLTAASIDLNGQLIERVNIQMRQAQQHLIDVEIDYGDLQTRLALAGDWTFDTLNWEGQIQRLQLRYPDLGRWNLNTPANLQVSPSHASLSNFCLMIATRESEVCAMIDWHQADERIAIDLDAENIPYQMFSPWIPDDVYMLGEFSVHVGIQQHSGDLVVDSRVEISDSSISVPAQELRVDFDAGELIRIQGDHRQLDANLRIVSAQLEGGIESHVSVYDALEENRRLEGEFGVDVRSFVLLSVLVPDIQDVTGQLSGRIDFDGPLDDLTIGGGLEFSDGSAQLPATGLELRNLNLVILAPTANEEPFTMVGDVDAGDGQLHIEGAYYLREQRAQLHIEGAAFPALNTRELQVTIAPNLQIDYTPELLQLRGEVSVPTARITPPDFETVDSISSDTVLVGGTGSPYEQSVGALPIDMDLTVNLGDDVQISAYGFEGRLEGGLRIIEQSGQETTAVGNIDVASGDYEIYGQALNIERGRLIFAGGPVANPGLDLRVERNIDNQSVTVGARVGGTLANPTFNLFSSPTMQDSAILSYLIFGRGPGEGSSGEQNMLARATLALGMSGGNRLGERLSDTFGVDEISLDSGDTFESTALYIGKQISSRLYIKYGVGLVEPVSTFFIQYRLTDNLNFESSTGNEHSGADVFYTIER